MLVTGATGKLGFKIVKCLVKRGFTVRALVRKTSPMEDLVQLGVGCSVGDMTDFVSLERAVKGMDYVVHAAADTTGTAAGGREITVQGTKYILELCKVYGIKKLVYISSCSVYGVAGYHKGTIITEHAALEPFPQARGAYSHAKFQAEKLVLEAMNGGVFPIVCLRPGTIFGPGAETYTPMMGISFAKKVFITIGDGRLVLPLVYIDNVADAVGTTLETSKGDFNVYNLIDPCELSKEMYIEKLVKKQYPRGLFFSVPYHLLHCLAFCLEVVAKGLKRPPLLTRYRLESSQKQVVYDGRKICRDLGWTPPVAIGDALNRCL